MAQGAAWRPPQEVCGDDLPLPAALCVVCERALQPRREDRYQDTLSLKAAIEEFLVGGLSFPTQAFQVGQCIVNEGEVGDTAFIIQRGYCRVFKYIGGEMRPLADLGPGDVFGEAAVFADTPRMATIQAISDVQVQVVSKEVFTKDLGVASSMGAFVRALATRFVTTDRELRSAQDQVRALTAAMAAMTPTAPLTTAEAPPPPPTPEMSMAAMAMMPLPPLPNAAPTAPPPAATPMAPTAPPTSTPTPEAAPTSTPAVPGTPVPSLWMAPASEPPPALVAAMARLYGMKLPAEEAARMIVAAATEAALRLRP
jgi:CRP-like cAMP-binding protein